MNSVRNPFRFVLEENAELHQLGNQRNEWNGLILKVICITRQMKET